MTPKVSVIIPTYNRAYLISRAIESVLKQTFSDYEIIVIDDGSKDNTRQVLEPYQSKIKYIYQDNRGVSLARNRGIQEALGEYIAFLDSDDAWMPDKLALQVDILDKNPKVGIVHHKLIILDDSGKQLGTKPKYPAGKNFDELIEKGGDLPTSSVITRKECFIKAGFFDENIPIVEDIEMWLRIAHDYEICEIPQALAYYYRHDNQISINTIKYFLGKVKFDQKVLRIYKNLPRKLINKRLSKGQYTLSRAYFDEKCYSEAFTNLYQAILRTPLVGILFININDDLLNKIYKFFKPYLFLIVCSGKLFVFHFKGDKHSGVAIEK